MSRLKNIIKNLNPFVLNKLIKEQDEYEAPSKLGFSRGEDFPKGINQEFSKFYSKGKEGASGDSLFMKVADKANNKIGDEINPLLDEIGDLALEFHEYTRMQDGGVIPYNLQNPASEEEDLPEVLFKLVRDLNKEAEFTLNKFDEEIPSYDEYIWQEQLENLKNNLQNVVEFLTSNFEGSETTKIGFREAVSELYMYNKQTNKKWLKRKN